ncbi:MAG: EAL domain-containing protein [Nocardioidaceae bacterium]|nr:EAL domain-containing protein [Nocardioidaceae bacterium]NUS52123.1 EAL domain-containing protein [Nocardioidaceae bacterium]
MTGTEDAHGLPGPLQPLPEEVRDRLGPHLDGLVDAFYERLSQREDLAEVLDRLTAEEFAHLRRRQSAHLRLWLSPDLDREQLLTWSRQVGRVHSMCGVELDWFVEGISDHRAGLLPLVDRLCSELDVAAIRNALAERMLLDLQGAVEGYRDVDERQAEVLLDVLSVVSDAATVTDLSRLLVETLGDLEGIEVVIFARPDAKGRMEHEVGGGPGFGRFLTDVGGLGYPEVSTSDELATGLGPIGRAWRSGDIERSDSMKTDPTTRPWWEFSERLGWASSAAVPLVDGHGRPRALLSLQARYSGYFAPESRGTLLRQVKRAAERALTDLEDRPTLATGVRGFAERARHLSLLRRDRVEMHFQPVVSLPDGILVKLEALARLRDGDRLVSPAEFLPTFGDEELFRLFEIGLDQGLDALRSWQAQGLSVGVSLNLPVVSITDDRYERLVESRLSSYGVRPERLTLELLETGFVDREATVRRRSFEAFTRMGVRLAQDDLGSGYSSLLRLRHFAFDEVKIDQSLVRGTTQAPGAALHFIRPISDIAHSIGLDVVIEGLEDHGLVEAATMLGVDAGQGFGIARPMPADDVVGWASGHRLYLDTGRPSTAIGALAAHVAWEHRVNAFGNQSLRPSMLDLERCVLTGYVEQSASRSVQDVHLRVHTEAVSGRRGRAYRNAWRDLLVALGEAPAG